MKLTILMMMMLFMMSMVIISEKLITMGLLLIITAMLTTTSVAIISNPWYSFILFLVYITGVLVLFGYFLAMSPNTHNSAKKCFKSYFFILPFFISPFLNFVKMPKFKLNFELDAIYLIINTPIYWLMVIILLLVLLMVVSLTYKAPTPLRNFLW